MVGGPPPCDAHSSPNFMMGDLFSFVFFCNFNLIYFFSFLLFYFNVILKVLFLWIYVTWLSNLIPLHDLMFFNYKISLFSFIIF